MKRGKIIYYAATALLTAMMLFLVSIYFFKYNDIATSFSSFGYPTYLIYPYGIAKLLGIIVLWLLGYRNLKEWAYSGFFFAFILAFFALYDRRWQTNRSTNSTYTINSIIYLL